MLIGRDRCWVTHAYSLSLRSIEGRGTLRIFSDTGIRSKIGKTWNVDLRNNMSAIVSLLQTDRYVAQEVQMSIRTEARA